MKQRDCPSREHSKQKFSIKILTIFILPPKGRIDTSLKPPWSTFWNYLKCTWNNLKTQLKHHSICLATLLKLFWNFLKQFLNTFLNSFKGSLKHPWNTLKLSWNIIKTLTTKKLLEYGQTNKWTDKLSLLSMFVLRWKRIQILYIITFSQSPRNHLTCLSNSWTLPK